MKRILREPLFHFLLAGAALFLVYGLVAGPPDDRPDRIVVGEDRVATLVRSFERTWARPPSASELRGLIDDYVDEEVLYREALALGLDRDDVVVRRRMRQKMEFLNDDLGERDPTDDELREFLAAHPDRFRAPSRMDFVQVFLGPEAGAPVAERAADLRIRLRGGADPGALGDRTLLPSGMRASTAADVASVFGPTLAEAVAEAPLGEWIGPVESGFGFHLILVSARETERLPALEEVRPAVAREWAADEREEALERFQQGLRERYEVEVRMPPDTAMPEMAGRP